MNEDLQLALKDRVATYALLARLFNKEIDEALLQELKHLDFSGSSNVQQATDGKKLIGKYLANLDSNSLTELSVDFTRIFIVRRSSDRNAAYPIESVYTSVMRRAMDAARDHVLSVYRAAGVTKSDSWKLSEDHIALELEFMQILAERTEQAFAANKTEEVDKLLLDQREFLQTHLISWVPVFAKAMYNNAHTDFYRGLALLLHGYLLEDMDSLSS